MEIFEVLMLICFGISWPISIAKAIRTKVVAGKSPVFMIAVATGYICGAIFKYYRSMDWVFYLYIFNCAMVLTDLCLYRYYSRRKAGSDVIPA